MKVLLTAINAKYIHSNLAVYCLKAYAEKYFQRNQCFGAYGENEKKIDIEIAEYTINQQLEDIMMDIYERKPDVLCLSCYIWNLTYVENLVREIHKVCPDMPVWLGGPEVSYDAEDVLRRLPEVTGVMMGEGEKTFTELCEYYTQKEGVVSDKSFVLKKCGSATGTEADSVTAAQETTAQETMEQETTSQALQLYHIEGITFRTEVNDIISNPWRMPMDLSEVPFVYHDMKDFEHKIVYYETSRGCPFSCSYCLSSIDKKLRFRNLALVKEELKFFIENKVPQVKFVDRTFNCKHDHAMEIWKFIKENDNGVTNFHFEVSADLLNNQEIDLLKSMRPGLVQLEIGVQSTNPDTIREIRRTMDFEKLAGIVNQIHDGRNIHQHLDLIAGLPYEDMESFARSFDDVYALKPHELQLGFLKVLKGSYMEEQKENYGLVYKSAPPYEVLFTKWITYEEVLRLKGIEEMVEVYYNSRQFEKTLEALEKEFTSMFHMYERIWEFYKRNNLHNVQHKRAARYSILLDFIQNELGEEIGGVSTEKGDNRIEYYRELLTYDYYLRENAKTRPEFAKENKVTKEFARLFYEKEAEERKYLPAYQKYDKNQLRKMTHLEYFKELNQTILFDYMQRNPINQEARTCIIEV